jgi:Flp pilus assembly protein TadG
MPGQVMRKVGRSTPEAERGSSAIELVLVTPLMILLVFGLIQAGLVWNARHVVSSAAQHGAREARTATALAPAISSTAELDGATQEQLQRSTLSFLRQTGGRGLTDATVTVRRDGSFVTVTVSGTTLGVLPGTRVRVSAASRTPLEGFRP